MSISGIVVLSMPHLTPGHMHSASLTVVAAVWQGPRGLALMAAMERESLCRRTWLSRALFGRAAQIHPHTFRFCRSWARLASGGAVVNLWRSRMQCPWRLNLRLSLNGSKARLGISLRKSCSFIICINNLTFAACSMCGERTRTMLLAMYQPYLISGGHKY